MIPSSRRPTCPHLAPSWTHLSDMSTPWTHRRPPAAELLAAELVEAVEAEPATEPVEVVKAVEVARRLSLSKASLSKASLF